MCTACTHQINVPLPIAFMAIKLLGIWSSVHHYYKTFCMNSFHPNPCRLTEDDVGEESVIQLHYVKYQNVQNITVSMADFYLYTCVILCSTGIFMNVALSPSF